jgi:hypothetical protein
VTAKAVKASIKHSQAVTAVGESQLFDLLQDHSDDIEATWVCRFSPHIFSSFIFSLAEHAPTAPASNFGT